jgi:hypothetical protein
VRQRRANDGHNLVSTEADVQRLVNVANEVDNELDGLVLRT